MCTAGLVRAEDDSLGRPRRFILSSGRTDDLLSAPALLDGYAAEGDVSWLVPDVTKWTLDRSYEAWALVLRRRDRRSG
ncbi:MAG: hypothetical protein JWL97_3548 [Gemmatimonadales bacterium]|nr:hypothetical protein [Gemmatimonadales bacterium]